ncbi:hypothetical protein AB7315_05865 [Providencia manganoxydans]|uniref:hypothetical protein n=1 Tax=Providencia manganoxydans TaxID=2923283 RepID=UPI0034E60232
MKIMHCSKCDCYYPKEKNIVCPACGNDKDSHTKSKHFMMIFLGFIILFSVIAFFDVALGLLVSLMVMGLYAFTVIKAYRKARRNNGYLYSKKAKNKMEAFKESQSRRLERNGPKKIAFSYSSEESTSTTSFHDDNDFNEFKDSLSIVWAENAIPISFSYRDALANRTRRNILLEEVSLNSFDELYFMGFCNEQADSRYFKVDRITSKIEYNGKKYDVNDFLQTVLLIDYQTMR